MKINGAVIIPEQFCVCVKALQQIAYSMSLDKGFAEEGKERNDAELIALMHSELSEALEALRDGNPESEKIPKFTSVEEELADVFIRILDYSGEHNLRLGEAIIAKIHFNKNRGFRHGKAF